MVMAKRGGYCLLSNSMYHFDQVRLPASRRLINKIVKLNKGESRGWKLKRSMHCETASPPHGNLGYQNLTPMLRVPYVITRTAMATASLLQRVQRFGIDHRAPAVRQQ
jgi:hypothetical protein